MRHLDIVYCIFECCTLVQPFDECELLAHPLAVCLCEQAAEIILTEVTDDLFLPSSYFQPTQSITTYV